MTQPRHTEDRPLSEKRNSKLENRLAGQLFSERSGDPELAEGRADFKEAAPGAPLDLAGRGFSERSGDPERSEGSRADSNGAQSASSDRSPVAGHGSLENSWIEIFRAGDYGERGRWTQEQLDQLAAAYDPRRHAAPVVLGHPSDDAPAYAWVKRLRCAGQSLWAQLEKVDPLFEALLRAGRFAQRSVALYTHFPPTGGPYLRHVGFLGAAPPAVKGLAPVRFADAACVTFAFDGDPCPATLRAEPSGQARHPSPATGLCRAESRDHQSPDSEDVMPGTKSKLEAFFDHLRAFFTVPTGSGDAPAAAGSSLAPSKAEGSAFAERLAALEQRLEALTAAPPAAPEKPAAPEESRSLSRAEARDARERIANLVESLRSQGRFPPAFERWGVREFMERLAEVESSASSASFASAASLEAQEAEEAKEAEEKATPLTLLAWFQEFLTRLPAVIEFRELGPQESRVTSHASRPFVRFTEPRRGLAVDPASVELAERAEALAAELGISYAEALTRLREEHHRTVTIA